MNMRVNAYVDTLCMLVKCFTHILAELCAFGSQALGSADGGRPAAIALGNGPWQCQ